MRVSKWIAGVMIASAMMNTVGPVQAAETAAATEGPAVEAAPEATVAATEIPAEPAAASLPTYQDYTEDTVFPANISIQGISLEGKTVGEVRQIVQDYVSVRQNCPITVTVFSENTYNYNGNSFGMTWTNTDVVDQAASYVAEGNFIVEYKNRKDLENSPVALNIDMTYDENTLRQQVNELAAYWQVEPVEPTVSRVNGEFVVQDGIDGRSIDAETGANELISLVSQYPTEEVFYDLPYVDVPTTYTADNFLFSDSPIGSYTTSGLDYAARASNIALSCENMNGTVVYPGEKVSALKMYGEVTEEKGYQSAGTYQDGAQIAGIGGGICQTTTTLYNAVLRAELQINSGDRQPHSMLVTYVPPSMDAMVDYKSHSDFKFVNNLANPIYIEAWADLGADTVTIQIWGVETRPANRSIDFVSEVLYCEQPVPLANIVVDDNVCKVGSTVGSQYKQKVEVTPHPSLKSRSYKLVYVDGVETERILLNEDTYSPMTGLIFKASDCDVSIMTVPDNTNPRGYSYQIDTFFPGTSQIWDPNLVPDSYYSQFSVSQNQNQYQYQAQDQDQDQDQAQDQDSNQVPDSEQQLY